MSANTEPQESLLQQILRQPQLLLRFKYSLRQQLAEENLEFLQTLQEMRSANQENPEPHSIACDVRALIDDFFLPSSPMELNVPGRVKDEVLSVGKKLCDDLLQIRVLDAAVTVAPMSCPARLYENFSTIRSRDSLCTILSPEDLLNNPFLVFLIAEKHIEGVLAERLRLFWQEVANERAADATSPFPLVRSPTMQNRLRVVIIGGGFCGSMVAQSLDPMSLFHVTLIDAKSYFEFTPSIVRLIPDPKADTIMYEHSEYIRNGQLVVSMANQVTPTHVVAGNGQHHIPYDFLVIAAGSSYASNLKADHMSSSFREKKIRQEHNRLVNAKTVLVIGGGIVGVEVASEIKSVFPDKQVTIVEANERLMKRNAPEVHRAVHKYLTEKLGISIILRERLTMFDQTRDEFVGVSGTHYRADMVYLCTGQVPRSEFMKPHYAHLVNEYGYIHVTDSHQLPGHDNMFCGGDVCATTDEKMLAMARYAAITISRNICRIAKGKPVLARGDKGTKPTTPNAPAQFVSLGRNMGMVVFNYKNAMLGRRWLNMKLSFKDKTFEAMDAARKAKNPFPLAMRVIFGRPPRALTAEESVLGSDRSFVTIGS
ncbi:hypothetical protein RI367_006112 [Sorochytrium milnesiophthora]